MRKSYSKMRHIQEANFLLEQRMLTERTERILSEQDKNTIMQVQKKLGLTADGIIGPQTTQAIMNYQKQNGLTADGKIGPMTLGKMGIASATSTQTTRPGGGYNSTTQTTTIGR
jgi:murein L,D-transpeptidase YcbB/YkuD